MPLLNVSISGKSDAALSTAIASELSELTAAHLGKDPRVTAVSINYIDGQDWFVGRQPLGKLPHGTFSLDIKITAGTNTKSEIATYLAAVFQGMSRILNGISDVSYVVVNEVPAANWGYAGQTQEFRSVVSAISKAA